MKNQLLQAVASASAKEAATEGIHDFFPMADYERSKRRGRVGEQWEDPLLSQRFTAAYEGLPRRQSER